ncbi:hypothetical protein LEP1GSC021_2256 [Leptospira noguchii str. 1993005606]|nr:hypothetical protein LEP1GSC021_2256 [Leptospira noguchii str. 1993005606]
MAINKTASIVRFHKQKLMEDSFNNYKMNFFSRMTIAKRRFHGEN